MAACQSIHSVKANTTNTVSLGGKGFQLDSTCEFGWTISHYEEAENGCESSQISLLQLPLSAATVRGPVLLEISKTLQSRYICADPLKEMTPFSD